MAQKRMLDKKISVSEKVADLPVLGQLLYTWMIPHTDDFGLLQGSARTLKAQVIPMVDVSLKEVEEMIDLMLESGLIKRFEWDGQYFIYITKFSDNQNLRQDMQPNSLISVELTKNYSENWQKIQGIIDQCLAGETPKVESFVQSRTSSDEIGTEVKRREDKLVEDSKEKEINKEKDFADESALEPLEEKKTNGNGEKKYSKIEEITETDLEDISEHYHVPLNFVKSKHEDMVLWAGSRPTNGKLKNRNWKLTLMKWVKDEAIKIYDKSKGDPIKRGIDATNVR